jgi:hypothetical protein
MAIMTAIMDRMTSDDEDSAVTHKLTMIVKKYLGDVMMKIMLKVIMINNMMTEMMKLKWLLGDGLPVDAAVLIAERLITFCFGISQPLPDKQVSLVTRENLCALLV